jgi:DNA polymerase-3 subunit epsilon
MGDFIAIDFETATESRESAISIGLVKYHNFRPIASYYSLIRPPKLYIHPAFTDIHGLTVDDVKDAPGFADIWGKNVKPFINGLPLTAHNAQFDTGILRAVLEWHELAVPRLKYFCTLALSRRVWPGLESYKLSALAEKFDIVYSAHNALDDALTCGNLVQLAAEKLGGKNSLEELLEAAGMEMKRL